MGSEAKYRGVTMGRLFIAIAVIVVLATAAAAFAVARARSARRCHVQLAALCGHGLPPIGVHLTSHCPKTGEDYVSHVDSEGTRWLECPNPDVHWPFVDSQGSVREPID